jgi:hypothetical protein
VNPLRHLLLVVALVLAQLAGAAHALEHAVEEPGAPPGYSCAFCLAAHDLGDALPAVVSLPPAVAPALPALAALPAGRFAVPPPSPSQRGPPAA